MTRIASSRTLRAGSASRPSTCCLPSRIRPSVCSKRRAARTTSTRRSQDRRSGGARPHHAQIRARSRRRRPALCCRCSAGARRRAPAGRASFGGLRRGRLFLVPGDSPVGLRLPLSSLPHVKPTDEPHLVPADPFADRGALPDPAAMARAFAGNGRARPAAPSSPGLRPGASRSAAFSPSPIPVRTALAVEPRDGRLCVFMPPIEKLEDYLELLAAVEATAAELSLPVHIEGYPPPHDPRLNVIKVTPDPGVIEVNIHPAGLARGGRHHAHASTRRPGSPGSAPTSS